MGVLEQAAGFPVLSPLIEGPMAGGRLGEHLRGCRTGGVVVSAPGEGRLYLIYGGTWETRVLALDGGSNADGILDVECEPVPFAAPRAYAVTAGGISVFPSGGPLRSFSSSGAMAFATPLNPNQAYAVVGINPTLQLYAADAGSLAAPSLTYGLSNDGGASLAWNEFGALLIGNPTARTVQHVVPTFSNGMVTGLFTGGGYTPPNRTTTSTFGKVVAAGDVTPDFNAEAIIASPSTGEVHVYQGLGSTPRYTLTGGPSFGAALAVDPRPLTDGGMHGLWVGEPDAERVHYFIGTRQLTFEGPTTYGAQQFGASLAVEPSGKVFVGAPAFGFTYVNQGAVWAATLDAGNAFGEAQNCTDFGVCQLAGCRKGTCIGGVLCQPDLPSTSACLTGSVCVSNVCVSVDGGPTADAGAAVDAGPVDAGAPDAGTPDAGTPDAGTPDAGTPDAGTPDAGTPDAGSPDAGSPDAGTPDAGSPDAGTPDAGTPDAGSPDAGARDAGVTDAGSEEDAGIADSGLPAPDGGQAPLRFAPLGCTSAPAAPLLLALFALTRRRGGKHRVRPHPARRGPPELKAWPEAPPLAFPERWTD